MSIFELHILPAVGKYYIDMIDLKTVQECVDEWALKYKKFKTFKNYMSSVFKEAMRHGFIEKNPCDLIILPASKDKEEIVQEEHENFYDKEELQLFLKCAEEYLDLKWYCFFRLLAFSGLRRGEALALVWKDIDFKQNSIRVNKNLTQGHKRGKVVTTPKTSSSNRVVKMDNKTMEILKQWKKEQLLKSDVVSIDQVVFNNTNNEYMVVSLPLKKLNAVVKKYGLKSITLHGFRHTHCSMLFESGASLKEVQQRLGHTDIKTTMNIYAHVSKSKKEEAVEKLASYLNF